MVEYSLEDIQNALADMTLHLPDPNEELFIQLDHNKTLRTFTVFNKLPLELRLSVWRKTFPGPRAIRLCYFQGPDGSPILSRSDNQPSYFPVALRVNRESRQETRRHYHTISHPSFQGPKHQHPLLMCINPLIDNFWIDLGCTLWCEKHFRAFLSALVKENTACFHAIEKLEIREIYESHNHTHQQAKALINQYQETIGMLLVLRGLKEVTLTASQIWSAASDRAERLRPAEVLKGVAVQLFEEHRSAFLTGQAPNVTTRVWHRLKRRSS